MSDNARLTNGRKLPQKLKCRLANGLALLVDADRLRRHHALPADSPLFLPRIADLYRSGVMPDDLHWLLENGFAALLCQKRDTSRGRLAAALLGAANQEIAIALTEAGAVELRRSGMALNTAVPEPGVALGSATNTTAIRYDAAAGELWLGEVLVLRLRRGSRSPAAVLEAFERRCWQQAITCPFKHLTGRQRSQALRDAVFGLNRRQQPLLIEFHSLGKGQRLIYLIVDRDEVAWPTAAPNRPR